MRTGSYLGGQKQIEKRILHSVKTENIKCKNRNFQILKAGYTYIFTDNKKNRISKVLIQGYNGKGLS